MVEYTETMTAEITFVHKLEADSAEYEALLRADPSEAIKILLHADDVRISQHKVFKRD